MAIIAPFKGMTYNLNKLGGPSSLIAPPYDVISEEEQEEYYQLHPYNVIRLILGKKKKGDSDWDNRYTRAVDVFKRWESDDILIRSNTPSMFVTSLKYDPGDGIGPRTRWGLITLVRIEEEGSGVILPHERTFSAHRDDRLKLMRACNAQFSQVFALYEDPENNVFRYFEKTTEMPPQISWELKDGTSHRMWAVHNETVQKKAAEAMAFKRIFIADGHHRYETSRNYRNMMRARYGHRPPNRAYEFVMMYLSNMDDKGLTILPSHRLVKRCPGFRLEPFLEKIGKWFDVAVMPVAGSNPSLQYPRLKELLEEKGRETSAIGFYLHGSEACHLLSLKPGVRAEMGDDLHLSLKKLDVLVLERLIFRKGLGFSKEDLDDEKIFQYQSDMSGAISLVDSGTCEMVFFLNPTKIGQVKEVAGHSLIMPRKSTYFYPKVVTGMVFNKIDPHEIIRLP